MYQAIEEEPGRWQVVRHAPSGLLVVIVPETSQSLAVLMAYRLNQNRIIRVESMRGTSQSSVSM